MITCQNTGNAPICSGQSPVTSIPCTTSGGARNYQLFRKSLKVPLVAVELAYGQNFELAETDADILVQLRGKHVMWQKERLLNLALSALPPSCRKVVWLDCDVFFDSEDWAERVSYLLDHSVLVQAFSDAHHLSPNWNSRETPTQRHCLHNLPPFQRLHRE